MLDGAWLLIGLFVLIGLFGWAIVRTLDKWNK